MTGNDQIGSSISLRRTQMSGLGLDVGVDPNKSSWGPQVESGRFYLAPSIRRRM